MNVISVIIGVVALIIALVGFIPLLGWLNWLAIPIAVVGLIVGMFDARTSGRNFNAVVIIFGVIRLFLGRRDSLACLAQLARPDARVFDRLHRRVAEAVFFKRLDARNRRAACTCYLVFKAAGGAGLEQNRARR